MMYQDAAHRRAARARLCRGRCGSHNLVQFLESRVLFAAGDLDTSFGGDGLVYQSTARIYDTAVQGDGKILAVGATTGQQPREYLVARFNANGTPDTSFGGDGRVTIDLPGDNDVFEYVAVAPGGSGRDKLVGEDGNDTLFARDNTEDVLDGGRGTDRAQRDALDRVSNIETFLA